MLKRDGFHCDDHCYLYIYCIYCCNQQSLEFSSLDLHLNYNLQYSFFAMLEGW